MRDSSLAKKVFSIVSHGQGTFIKHLLNDIKIHNFTNYEVILTLNIPENEQFIEEFADLPITVVRNDRRKGFGGNHNAAFNISNCEYFFVINPDIRLIDIELISLMNFMESHRSVGVCGPKVLSGSKETEDSCRFYPTTPIMIKRIFRRLWGLKNHPDYIFSDLPIQVDWVAGMFMIFRKEAFLAVSGFDEKYYMYYEDADICRRLHKKKWGVYFYPKLNVQHDAQRNSGKSASHLKWHVESLLRIICTR
jgi:GT2 family glycosyltransferase